MRLTSELQQQSVLAVLNARDNALPWCRGGIVVVIARALLPIARDWIDEEAVNFAFAASAKALVETRDRRAGTVGERRDLTLSIGRGTVAHVEAVITSRPFEGRLQFESLTLPLLVIGSDPLGRQRRHVFDPKDVPHHVRVAKCP